MESRLIVTSRNAAATTVFTRLDGLLRFEFSGSEAVKLIAAIQSWQTIADLGPGATQHGDGRPIVLLWSYKRQYAREKL